MKKNINDISEIPEWFEDHKYDGIENLSLLEILENLKARERFFKISKIPKETFPKEWKNIYKIRKDPLSAPYLEEFRRIKNSKDRYDSIFNKNTVIPMTTASLCHIHSIIPEDDIKNANEYIEDVFVNNTSKYSEIKYRALEPLKNFISKNNEFIKDKEYLEVDISLPSNVLIEHFSQYINKIQKEKGITSINKKLKVIEKEIEHISRYKILQYLDLTIWANEKNISITNDLMVDILFLEDDTKDEASIRKTINPKAIKAISSNILNLFESVVLSQLKFSE